MTKETKLRQLQLKLLHRIIPTNKWLHKTKLINTSNCSFCDISTETIEHLFWECLVSKTIWLQLKDWLGLQNFFSMKQVILGDPMESPYIEHLKLITKEFIYTSKLLETEPRFCKLIQIIKSKIKVEKSYLNRHVFEQKWGMDIITRLNL